MMQKQDVEVFPGKSITCLERLPHSDLSRVGRNTGFVCVCVKQMATTLNYFTPQSS